MEYRVTEQDYYDFVESYESVVRDYKDYEPKNLRERIECALVEKLEYKPLAFVPTVKYDSVMNWNDGSVSVSEMERDLMHEFLVEFERYYCNADTINSLYGNNPTLQDWKEYTGTPNIVDIGDEYNEWAMKIAEMRGYEITEDIVDEMVDEFGEDAFRRLFVKEHDFNDDFFDMDEQVDDEWYERFNSLSDEGQWEWYIENYPSPEAWMMEKWGKKE